MGPAFDKEYKAIRRASKPGAGAHIQFLIRLSRQSKLFRNKTIAGYTNQNHKKHLPTIINMKGTISGSPAVTEESMVRSTTSTGLSARMADHYQSGVPDNHLTIHRVIDPLRFHFDRELLWKFWLKSRSCNGKRSC